MSTSASSPRLAHRLSPSRTAITLTVACVIAIALNSAVAAIAAGAGAAVHFAPLTLPVYGSFTVLGVVIGWIGWRIVQRRAENPARVLRILVPVVGLLSFTPDVLLMTLHYLPGATVAGAAALMVMHVVVIATAVPAYVFASRPAR